MKKYFSILFVATFILVGVSFARNVLAETIFSDSFGTISTDNVPGWIDGGGVNDGDTYTTNGTSRPGSLTTQNARVRHGGYIIKTVNTTGYNNIYLKYYWRGDDDGDGNSDTLKVFWKKTSDPISSFNLINSYRLDDNNFWSSQVSVPLSTLADNTSIDIKFLGDSNAIDEEARIDDVSVDGDVIDATPPVITINPYNTSLTNQDVTVTASTNEGTLNADSHTFTGNGSFDFIATDNAGNSTTQTVTISNIDKTPPVITLTGGDMSLHIGESFIDPGSSATDTVDPAVSVIVSGTVDTSLPGTYTLYYNAADTAGNQATQVVRTVTVVDVSIPIITLLGSSPAIIEVGTAYTDAGATAVDDVDGDITSKINVVNPVDTGVVGSYSVTYNVSDSSNNPATEIIRTVNVVDTTLPIIALLGSDSVSLTVGDPYTDAGATAADNYDGDITKNILVINPVNTAVAGTYIVTYNVIDANNNQALQVARNVKVNEVPPVIVDPTPDPVPTPTLVVHRSGGYLRTGFTSSNTGGQVLGAETFIFTQSLKLGSKGNEVLELQKKLIADGYLKLNAPTGYFGVLTQKAVKAFQAANGLVADGIVGPLTRAALNK